MAIVEFTTLQIIQMCDLIYGIYGLYLPAWMSAMSAPVFLPRWCRCPVLLLPLRCTRLIQVDKRGLQMMKRRTVLDGLWWTRSIRKDVILVCAPICTGNNRKHHKHPQPALIPLINRFFRCYVQHTRQVAQWHFLHLERWNAMLLSHPVTMLQYFNGIFLSRCNFLQSERHEHMRAMSCHVPLECRCDIVVKVFRSWTQAPEFCGSYLFVKLLSNSSPSFSLVVGVLWDPKVRHEGLFTLPC